MVYLLSPLDLWAPNTKTGREGARGGGGLEGISRKWGEEEKAKFTASKFHRPTRRPPGVAGRPVLAWSPSSLLPP